ncbi:MAG: glycosyltransferase, partial [Patescibacteria group bacterium]
LLVTNLKRNLSYLKGCEIVIINDDPTESIKHLLQDFKVTLFENKTNLGFAGTVDLGIKKSSGEYVMLLNSDVVLLDDSYLKGLESLKKNTNVFAVSFAQKEKDDEIVGKNKLFWKNGFVMHEKADSTKSGLTGWAEGGSCIIDKEKYMKIGGFDSVYKPFYWEDIDLSYRAWKAGMSVYFDKDIVVEHHHETTIGKYFPKKTIETVAYRNQLIFIWKNITDMNLLGNHLSSLLILFIRSLFTLRVSFLLGLLQAKLRTPLILYRRHQQKKMCILSDANVFEKIH